jgi:hypothetical protein
MYLCVSWCGNLIHLSHLLKNLIRVVICLIYFLLLQYLFSSLFFILLIFPLSFFFKILVTDAG